MSDTEETEVPLSWEDFGLDFRLVKSIKLLGWKNPTLIQEKTIQLSLAGKDIIAKGRTGSGKTGAYLIPILNKIISEKKMKGIQKTWAVILAPTKELSHQISSHAKALNRCSSNVVNIVNICENEEYSTPDIVVSTPFTLLSHYRAKKLSFDLNFFVVDEADLMFSFGHEKSTREVIEKICTSSSCQYIMTSATLDTSDKNVRKCLPMKKPAILKLQEPMIDDKLQQFQIKCSEEEKYVLLVSLFKLNLIRGKSLIFVNNVNKCYKLKIVLDQFSVRACILNSELPAECRCHAVEQFNKGVYDIIIANDERMVIDAGGKSGKNGRKKNHGNKRQQSEYSNVSRGIDFQFVSNVINFDFPLTVESFIHRVGRTARGCLDTEGTALSLICPNEEKLFKDICDSLGGSSEFKPYVFVMQELEAFKYRVRDALKNATLAACKKARYAEIKREILRSEKLKSFLESHPKDKIALMQNDKLRFGNGLDLSNVPDYIVPAPLKGTIKSNSIKRKWEPKTNGNNKKRRKRTKDPLDVL